MSDVPADTAVTNPEEEPTVATEGVALDQVPPVEVLVQVVELPNPHKVLVPLIVCARGAVTVTLTGVEKSEQPPELTVLRNHTFVLEVVNTGVV